MTKNSSPATKKDLKKAKNDLNKKIDGVEKRLDEKIDGVEKSLRAEIKITAKETKQDLKEEMSKNTSKILNTFDKFLKEIIDSRQEREIVSKELSEHEERIDKLEKHVFAS